MEPEPLVFISHKHSDREIAETIARTPVDKYIEGYESVLGSSRKSRALAADQEV